MSEANGSGKCQVCGFDFRVVISDSEEAKRLAEVCRRGRPVLKEPRLAVGLWVWATLPSQNGNGIQPAVVGRIREVIWLNAFTAVYPERPHAIVYAVELSDGQIVRLPDRLKVISIHPRSLQVT
ncbi:MAG: hypothetical protein WCT37_01990 [Patescibacteria group bacterium]|jgi:hypothetical protein